MLLIFFISFVILTAWVWYRIANSRCRELGNRIPGPKSLPILGNANHFLNVPSEDNLKILGEFFIKYGETYRLWFGNELNVLSRDQKDLKVIMSGIPFVDKASVYDLISPWLNEGLLVSKGKKWHGRRKIITPAFHFKILEDYLKIFEKQGKVFCKILEQHVGSESFELLEYASRYTLDVISGRKWFQRRKIITPAFHFKVLEQFIDVFNANGRKLVQNISSQLDKDTDLYFYVNLCTLDTIGETAMGVSVNAQTNTDSEYVKAVKTIATVLHKRMFNILYRLDFTYQFTQLARDEKKALGILHGFTEKIILQRREEILRVKENKVQSEEANEDGVKRKKAFLDILLESEIDGKPLSNLDIREEVDTFMFEGHDTTSSAITFFFYNIAIYPETQKKCFQEILETFGSYKTKPVTYEDLNNLHYTELCIKETLRLYPSVPLLGRKVTEECEINGKLIPAGTNIGISPLHLGRMEEIFPNANEFIPERFDVVTNTEKMNPYAYIPFSAGPRNCIGQKFAMLEIKSVVVNVLRNFEVNYAGTASGEPLLIGELILRTRDPLMFKLKPRVYN